MNVSINSVRDDMNVSIKSVRDDMNAGFRASRDYTDASIKSLRDEMKASFTETHQRIDILSLTLSRHIKDCDMRFQKIDERFDQIDRRFDQIDRRFGTLKHEIASQLSKEISQTFGPYFMHVEKMLDKHEGRIDALEQRTGF
jgi:hypothetical protein